MVRSKRLEQFFPEAKPGVTGPPTEDRSIDQHSRRPVVAPQRLQRVGDLVVVRWSSGKNREWCAFRPLRRSGGDHMAVGDALRSLNEDGSGQS